MRNVDIFHSIAGHRTVLISLLFSFILLSSISCRLSNLQRLRRSPLLIREVSRTDSLLSTNLIRSYLSHISSTHSQSSLEPVHLANLRPRLDSMLSHGLQAITLPAKWQR